MTKVRQVLGVLVIVTAYSQVGSAKPPMTKAPAAEKGFRPLFNGKDFKGWVYGKKGGGENKTGLGYQIENGTIYCTKNDGGNLYANEEFADFVLRFEVRLEANANNGVGIRAPLEGDSAYVGIETQILDDSGDEYKALRPAQYHGSVYDVVAAERGHQRPLGEWNEEEITAKGRKITIKLNGVTIVDTNLDDVKDEAVLKKHPGLARDKGYIGFLGHGTRVDYRNIRIKRL